MKLFTPLLFIASLLIFTACNKETSNPQGAAASLKGSYTFIGEHVKTSSENTVKEGGNISKAITKSEYDTKENAGDIVIDDANFNYTNLSYKIDAVAHSSQYENGQLQFDFDYPLQLNVTPQSGSAPYKVISADSVYFSSGSFISDGTSQATQPSGATIKFDGDKLIITQKVSQTIKSTQAGAELTAVVEAVAIVTLQKK